MTMKRNVVKSIVAIVLMIVAFYGGWLIRGASLSAHGATDDVVPDESSTFNTIDSILLQAISYRKAKDHYPEFGL